MTRAWGGILPPPHGQGYYPSDFAPATEEPGLPDVRGAVAYRHLAEVLRRRNPRPSTLDSLPAYASLSAIHAIADAFDEMAEAIDPTPPQREPFDEAAARKNLEATRALINDLKGKAS